MRPLFAFILLCACVGPLVGAQSPTTPPPPVNSPNSYAKPPTPPPPSAAERKKLCICGKPLEKGEKKQKVEVTPKDGKKHAYLVCSDECAQLLKVMTPEAAVNLMQTWLNPPTPQTENEAPKPPEVPKPK